MMTSTRMEGRGSLSVLVVLALTVGGCTDIAEPTTAPNPEPSASVQSGQVFQLTPERVHLEQIGSMGLVKGELVDASGQATKVKPKFWSENTSIVSVDAKGWIAARRTGSARVIASYGSSLDTTVVAVGPAETGTFRITEEEAAIDTVGGTVKLVAEVLDPAGVTITNPVMSWSTPTPDIVEVTTGAKFTNVTAVAKGRGLVVAHRGELADTATVWVGPKPPELLVTPGTMYFDRPGMWKVSAEYSDPSGTVAVVPDYRSTRTSVVRISADGWVTAVSNGSAAIIAAHGSVADTVQVKVGGLQTAVLRITNDPDSIASAGGMLRLLTEILDPTGERILNPKVTWSSLTPEVATVSGTNGVGKVTAVANGTGLIVAARDGKADTATVFVGGIVAAPPPAPPTPVSLIVSPALDTLPAPGATLQLTAQVRDEQGNVLSNQPVSWASRDASIATVDANGRVTAIRFGTAQVIAVQGPLADTATIVIRAPLPVGPTVALEIVRLDGGSGSALVTNGIPLPPGWLRPGEGAQLRVVVGNQEQPVYVEELKGVHADGSVRSVLVQFAYTVGSQPIAAQLVKASSARTTPQRSKTAVNYTLSQPVPQAVALPTDPDYLMSTKIVGPTVGVAEADAFEPLWQSRFRKTGDAKFAQHVIDYQTVKVDMVIVRNYYDRGLIHFAYWVRSGSAEHFKRAIYYTLAYRERYLQPNGYTVQPHEMHIEGVALLYRLLGDEESRTAVEANAKYFKNIWLPKLKDRTYQYTEGRPLARSIEGFITALKVGVPGSWDASLREALNAYLTQQSADGAYRYGNSCNLSSNFMTGLFNDALIRYWEEFEQDARIPAAIRKSVDWLWATQWNAAQGGFNYYEGYCAANRPIGMAGGNSNPAPDLNLLIVNGFGFVYQVTGDPVYRQRGDTVFHEGIERAWFGSHVNNGDKQFNQQYRSAFRYLSYRQ